MRQHAMVAAALGSLLALGAVSTPMQAADTVGEEKYYSVAEADQNDCASPGNTHACASQSKVDRDPMSWKYVPAGTCTQMGNTMQPASK